jgi:hypothetical protein
VSRQASSTTITCTTETSVLIAFTIGTFWA